MAVIAFCKRTLIEVLYSQGNTVNSKRKGKQTMRKEEYSTSTPDMYLFVFHSFVPCNPAQQRWSFSQIVQLWLKPLCAQKPLERKEAVLELWQGSHISTAVWLACSHETREWKIKPRMAAFWKGNNEANSASFGEEKPVFSIAVK